MCFSCDEKFTPGHKCKQPQLFIMEGENEPEYDEEEERIENDQPPEITLHTLSGWDAPTTICLRAGVGNRHVLALVDSGSTHNFISTKAAQKLRLRRTATPSFLVRVANGEPMKCEGRFDEVEVKIGEATFTMMLHALTLVGLDLVLGVKWLETLGPVT